MFSKFDKFAYSKLELLKKSILICNISFKYFKYKLYFKQNKCSRNASWNTRMITVNKLILVRNLKISLSFSLF